MNRRRYRMLNADIESWALARAHHIVLNEGLNLAKAAQDLDRKRSRSLVYELRKVITAAIVEAHAASFDPDGAQR
ncbi:hypothetical protein ACOJBM_28350 [Rhizobium beringeri]|uniref:Uncharacterized protein n=13 Tax=Rhizobium TaxID=379 RepID=A0A3S4AF13_RHILE|nr:MULTISPECIES: hypothetical protein [Rhizobium]MBX4860654.1 hypothetical protein [Rhizobium bangladeshense]NNU41399.1 hypothetical protein [Rhizobium sophorae]ASR08723.1 hypothetical protein CHY08_17390 [Rhizobium leguminosarum bv. viciae]KAF5880522.1 hypothetical protein FY112_35115 [Rhizobium sp. PEPV16]MBA1346528.1 hypothetical protein [Rhizobium sp. WYCCWR 11146]